MSSTNPSVPFFREVKTEIEEEKPELLERGSDTTTTASPPPSEPATPYASTPQPARKILVRTSDGRVLNLVVRGASDKPSTLSNKTVRVVVKRSASIGDAHTAAQGQGVQETQLEHAAPVDDLPSTSSDPRFVRAPSPGRHVVLAGGATRECNHTGLNIYNTDANYLHCDLCCSSYANMRDFLLHFSRDHKGMLPFACTVRNCETRSHTLQRHRVHVNMHGMRLIPLYPQRTRTLAGAFRCSDCGVAFARQDLLDKHRVSVHTRDAHPFVQRHYLFTPLLCDMCELPFDTINKLVAHVRKHTPIGVFACPKRRCTMRFNSLEHLTLHSETHWPSGRWNREPFNSVPHSRPVHPLIRRFYMGVVPLCDICSTKFANFEELAAHVFAVHAKVTFGCPVPHCDKRFYDLDELLLHRCNPRDPAGIQLVDNLDPPLMDDDCHPLLRKWYLQPPYYRRDINHKYTVADTLKDGRMYECPLNACRERTTSVREIVVHCDTAHWPMREWMFEEEVGLEPERDPSRYLRRVRDAMNKPMIILESTRKKMAGHSQLVQFQFWPQPCEFRTCSHTSDNVAERTMHLYVFHHLLRPFGCPLQGCPERYTLLSSLVDHYLSHWQASTRFEPALLAASRLHAAAERPTSETHTPPGAKEEHAEELAEVKSETCAPIELSDEKAPVLEQQPLATPMQELHTWMDTTIKLKMEKRMLMKPALHLYDYCHPVIRECYLKDNWRCDTCGETLAEWTELTAHLRVHHGYARPFACPHKDCDARRLALVDLLLHSLEHWPNAEWDPNMDVDETWRRRAELAQKEQLKKERADRANEERERERAEKRQERQAYDMMKRFTDVEKFITGDVVVKAQYLEYLHPLTAERYLKAAKKCDLCEATVWGFGQLRQHMRVVHSEHRPFVCPVNAFYHNAAGAIVNACSARFGSFYNLVYHCAFHWPNGWTGEVVAVEEREEGEEDGEWQPLDRETHADIATQPLFPHSLLYFRRGMYCVVCSRLCRHIDELRSHMSSAHRVKWIFKCEKCDVGPMNTLVDLRQHYAHAHADTWSESYELITVEYEEGEGGGEGGRPRQSYTLSEYHSLKLRPLVPTTRIYFENGLFCYICGVLCDDVDMLAAHVSRRHAGALPLKCESCIHTFRTMPELLEHCTKHRRFYSFMCKVPGCGRILSSKSSLRGHEFECKRMRGYAENTTCDLCGRQCHSAASLRTHRLGCVGMSNGRFECPGCDRTYAQKQAMTNHMLQEHPGLWEQHIYKFQCTQCASDPPVRFRALTKLREHFQKQHPDYLFYSCSCGQRFLSQSMLARHLNETVRGEHENGLVQEYQTQGWSREQRQGEQEEGGELEEQPAPPIRRTRSGRAVKRKSVDWDEEEGDDQDWEEGVMLEGQESTVPRRKSVRAAKRKSVEEVGEEEEAPEQEPTSLAGKRRSSRAVKGKSSGKLEEDADLDGERPQSALRRSRRSVETRRLDEYAYSDEEMEDEASSGEDDVEEEDEDEERRSGEEEEEEKVEEAPPKRRRPAVASRRSASTRAHRIDSQRYSIGFTKEELGGQSNEEVRAILAEGVSLDCRFCDHSAVTYLGLNAHYRSRHPDHPQPFRCPCGKTFSNHASLPKHQRVQHWRLKGT